MKDPISNQRLALVHPTLAAKVNSAEGALEAQGIFIRVAQGLRTYAQQDALFALGRTVLTKPDGTHQGIVTKARGGWSNHNFGCAVDCYPFLGDVTTALDWDPDSTRFKAMIEAMETQGLAAGAEWHSITDPPHFQLANVPVTPTDADRAAFAAGGLPAVWALYD